MNKTYYNNLDEPKPTESSLEVFALGIATIGIAIMFFVILWVL